MSDFPAVVGRAYNEMTGGEACWVRMSAEDGDVVHLDFKAGERVPDDQVVLCAEYMQELAALKRARP